MFIMNYYSTDALWIGICLLVQLHLGNLPLILGSLRCVDKLVLCALCVNFPSMLHAK